ncbi:MAG: M23 family metallopeptidase [Myxococcota bacterium]
MRRASMARSAMWMAVCFAPWMGCSDDAPTDTSSDTTDETDVPNPEFEAVTRLPSVDPLPIGIWPVQGGVLESGFAPRRLIQGDRDDFHTGQDFYADKGTPVLATQGGTVFRVQPTDGDRLSNRVILAHAIPSFEWQGEPIDTLYTFHGQLDTIDVVEGDDVSAGDVIGTVGDTGGVSTPHLHFEARLGTHCSLAFSTANPESSCARSYDPAVNPLRILPRDQNLSFVLNFNEEDSSELFVQTRRNDQDWSRVETNFGTLDFDLRTGMDATSATAIDNLDFGWVKIVPDSTSGEGGRAAWRLQFAEQPAWVEVIDIDGEGERWVAPE